MKSLRILIAILALSFTGYAQKVQTIQLDTNYVMYLASYKHDTLLLVQCDTNKTILARFNSELRVDAEEIINEGNPLQFFVPIRYQQNLRRFGDLRKTSRLGQGIDKFGYYIIFFSRTPVTERRFVKMVTKLSGATYLQELNSGPEAFLYVNDLTRDSYFVETGYPTKVLSASRSFLCFYERHGRKNNLP